MKPAGFPFLLAAIVLPFSALAREEHRFGVNCTSLSDCEPTYVCTGLPSLSYPQKIPPIPIYGTCGNCRVNADCGKVLIYITYIYIYIYKIYTHANFTFS